jgi:hypothetical protein
VSCVVFVGATLTATDVAAGLDATYLPPAAAGDVYRAALAGPRAIGIVDGWSDARPALRHKEVLWAMSRGIHVFGAGGLGALRAAELAAFGMVGVGEVFRAYASGELEDDDEVAWLPGRSEPLVNIRATLARAEAAGFIADKERARLVAAAKALHYRDRTYDRLLGAPADWLAGARFDQMRLDALAMLREMRARLEGGYEPNQVAYRFERTHFFEALCDATRPRTKEGKMSDQSQGTSGGHLFRGADGKMYVIPDSHMDQYQVPDQHAAAATAALGSASAARVQVQSMGKGFCLVVNN